jgi:asparagine synthase (glutamine-hydrolysing)
MCRIYGYLGRNITPEIALRVAEKELHGGPDGQGYLSGNDWGIGCNRLAIIDLLAGNQPYVLGDSIKVVFNGEIYNHHELRDELMKRGYSFSDHCDGSIIPALYLEHGLEFLCKLDGMFALAIIDTRETTKLILASDPIGIKPLYYYWDNQSYKLLFSSEIPSLLQFGISPQLWLPGVDAYFTTKSVWGKQTMLTNVFCLEPSSILIVTPDFPPQLFRYESKITTPKPPSQLAIAGVDLRNLLKNEVQSLLRADVPVATINSGGLDSSLITILASELTSDINSFHITYAGEWPSDERHFARQVAAVNNIQYHELELEPQLFGGLLGQVVSHLGQPNADPITLSSYALFQHIHAVGFKVVLSGDGADEMFGGYDRFVSALNYPDDWIDRYIDLLGVASKSMRWNIYHEEYRSYLHDVGFTSDILAKDMHNTTSDRLAVMLDLERRHRLPIYHLQRVDHLSMAHAVEVRVPYCQPRIASYASQLASKLKVEGMNVKRVLKEAASPYLPSAILHRPKQPFTLPIQAMMRNSDALLPFVKTVLTSSDILYERIINKSSVLELLNALNTSEDSRIPQVLWAVMILVLWAEALKVSCN